MAEGGRKTWAAAGSIQLKETEGPGRNEVLSAQGVDPSYREYLAVLQEKNRILRELRKKEEERQAAISERERGFDLNFKGANEDRIRRKQVREQARGAPRAASAGARHRSAGDAGVSRNRSTWHQGSVHIQTMRGSVVRLAPPRGAQTRESMQWLVSEEGRSWLETEDGQDWLEDREGEEGGPLEDDTGGQQVTSKQVQGALALVKATLKYNGLSVEVGFAEFDSDNDGRITLQDVDGVVKALAMELTGP